MIEIHLSGRITAYNIKGNDISSDEYFIGSYSISDMLVSLCNHVVTIHVTDHITTDNNIRKDK